jgi:hypothetical protein
MSEKLVICGKCGRTVVSDYRICAKCGNDLLAQGGSRPIRQEPSGSQIDARLIGPGIKKTMPIVLSGDDMADPEAQNHISSNHIANYEGEEKMSVGGKVVNGIDMGFSIAARIYGCVLVVGGIVGAVTTGSPVLLLVSAYGVYLVLGGSWVVY